MDTGQAKELVEYWTEHADYDLETAQAMFETKRFPYCLFMCHLAIEKLLKALVVARTKEHAEYTHDLVYLAKMTALALTDPQFALLSDLRDFNIEARYPEAEKAFYKKATREYTEKYLLAFKGLYLWLKTSLPK